MIRIAISIFATAFCVSLLVPTATYGKGASSGAIVGPGLEDPIVMNGTWNQLGRIAEAGGFYAAVFGREPNPLLAKQPPGELGPRYTITYVMPGPFGVTDELVQDVYPYAQPAPVTRTTGGQGFFGDHETRHGWFVASPELKAFLVEAGLPESAPIAAEGPGSIGPGAAGAAVALASVLVAGALAAIVLRRRPRLA